MGPLWIQVALALLAQAVGARDEDNRLNNNKEVVTLRTPGAFLETLGKEGDSVLNVSIEVRTYQQSGLLLYHQLGKKGHVRLSVSEGVVVVEVVIGDDMAVHLAEWGSRVDDGAWHQVGLVVGGGMMELHVGERRVQTPGLGKLVTGSLYRVGGGLHGQPGFTGCLRLSLFSHQSLCSNALCDYQNQNHRFLFKNGKFVLFNQLWHGWKWSIISQ